MDTHRSDSLRPVSEAGTGIEHQFSMTSWFLVLLQACTYFGSVRGLYLSACICVHFTPESFGPAVPVSSSRPFVVQSFVLFV